MPVLNEEVHLEAAVKAILAQDYPQEFDIVLALGPSRDNTTAIAQKLVQQNSRVHVVPNPSGKTPDALNLAIAQTKGEIIVRVDAHSELSPGYIKSAVETLQRTGADNVGGIMKAQGITIFERAVAVAMTSPLGVGGGAFHVGGQQGPVDTVYLGVFVRSALERVGGYDSRFVRAQDWEMNFRIRSSGGIVWFDPALVVRYRPRRSLRALAQQYFQYGSWRREVIRIHPTTATKKSNLRYFAPPLAVLGSILGTVLALSGMSWAAIAPIGYGVIVLGSTVVLSRKAGLATLWLPVVLVTMHWSWGTGFLTSRRKIVD